MYHCCSVYMPTSSLLFLPTWLDVLCHLRLLPCPLVHPYPCSHAPLHTPPSQSGDAPSHSTCSPVSLLPCFPVSMLQWGPGSPKPAIFTASLGPFRLADRCGTGSIS